ncbi:MAG: nucleotidyltransferase domain-containing protein [Nitrospirae bacterium]|nr:nucleotidyltransferase domain-containing protein [Nitrospirota bacterium]
MWRIDVLRKINIVKERIVREYRPQQIILFGSYAYGHPVEESDVDVLIIMQFKGKAAFKAIEILEKVKPPFPIDLIVRTPQQVKTRIAQNDFFMREVLKKGKVLYATPH